MLKLRLTKEVGSSSYELLSDSRATSRIDIKLYIGLILWVVLESLYGGIRLADMQKHEPTCRVGGPRCKKPLGDARLRRTCRIGGPTCKRREPTCRAGGPRCKNSLGDARLWRTCRTGGPTCRKREPTCSIRGQRCKTTSGRCKASADV